MRPPGTRSRKFNYLRAYDCKYRESLARLKKSKILTICLENPFREIYSKKIFRSLKNQMCPRKWRKTKTRVFTFLQPSSAVSADFLFYSFISFPYQRLLHSSQVRFLQLICIMQILDLGHSALQTLLFFRHFSKLPRLFIPYCVSIRTKLCVSM